MNMYENAIDSIAHAIQHYSDITSPEARRYKYTLLHLSQGVLLILKVRLSKRERLLIRKMDKQRIDERTVDFEDIKSRLKNLEKPVDLNYYDLTSAIDKLGKTRNEIEHYEFEIDSASSDELIADTFQFLQHFFQDQMPPNVANIADEVNGIEDGLWQKLVATKGYLPHAKKAARRWIENKNLQYYQCSCCNAKAATIDKHISLAAGHSYLTQLVGDTVRCNACYSQVGFITTCPGNGCNKPVYVECDNPRIGYCDHCRENIEAAYNDVSYPLLAAEVKRSTQKIRLRIAGFEKLQEFLGIAPSWDNLVELLSKGYVRLSRQRAQARFLSAIKNDKAVDRGMFIDCYVDWIKN